MTAIAPQLQMDLRIPTRRPLLPMKAVMVFLDRNEDDVLALIGSRKLIAFDVAQEGAERQYPLVWRRTCIDYVGGCEKQYPEASIINDILPDVHSLRAVELKNLLSVNQWLIQRHVEDGCLALDPRFPIKAGRGNSPWITRASAAEFLKQRRIS